MYTKVVVSPVVPLFYRIALLLTFLLAPIFSSFAQHNTRIINGEDAKTGEWPFMVALVDPNAEHISETVFCGGTLISDKFVVTAAHCVYDSFFEEPVDLDSVSVMAGSQHVTQPLEIIAPSEIIVHPAYNPEYNTYDIALIRLSRRVPFEIAPLIESIVEPAALQRGNGVVLGWGYTDPKYPISPDRLQVAQVPVHSAETCRNIMGLLFDTNLELCAGTLSTSSVEIDGVDTCYGDSGGPLLLEHDGQWYLSGITTWGWDCATSVTYGVYLRINPVREWITTQMNDRLRLKEILQFYFPLLQKVVLREKATADLYLPPGIYDRQSARRQLRKDLISLRRLSTTNDSAEGDAPGLSRKVVRRLSKLTKQILRSKHRPALRRRLLRKAQRLLATLSIP